jgi:hypothetical protein
MLKYAAVASLTLFATAAMPASAAPFMIVGNDEKPGTDAQGKSIVNPSGNDTVVIFDLANPEAPTVAATLKLENSIVGPPTNLAIAPDNSIALVADSMTVAEENGTRKFVPTDKVFVIDLKANPPSSLRRSPSASSRRACRSARRATWRWSPTARMAPSAF